MNSITKPNLLPIELQEFSAEPLSLPFTIEVVRDQAMLEQCIALRHEAYTRHSPELGRLFAAPEAADFDPAYTNLVARSKLSGDLMAAVRVEIRDQSALGFESSFEIPKALKTGPLAEISRLAVADRVGYSPRLMMIKAAYWFCRSQGVVRHFITARSPADRMYRRFEMFDLVPNQGMVPIQTIGNVPHRIMWIDVFEISSRWSSSGNPLLTPIFLQSHPEILDDLQARTVQRELQEFHSTHALKGA
ncbi:MAG: hypothetical protein R3194_06435 [Limnobacter sp.]|nr:hypothetical protein [Limnobacter sp.]